VPVKKRPCAPTKTTNKRCFICLYVIKRIIRITNLITITLFRWVLGEVLWLHTVK